jgi:hypothetical protein
MASKKATFCPLIKKDCVEHKCLWFTQVRGQNPNTGEPLDEWGCAMNLLPVLLIENARQQRSTAAAVESFRNETVTRNDTTNTLLYTLAQQPAMIEPVQINLLNGQEPTG